MSILLTLLTAAALQAGQEPDPRWNAFIGCWQAEAVPGEEAPAPMLCIRPSGDAITIATVVDGVITGARPLRIGSGALEEGGCRGTESTRWSVDGRRLLISSEMTCAGDLQRSSHGVLALVSRAALVDIQSVAVPGDAAVRLVRYVAVEPADHPAGYRPDAGQALAYETARAHAAVPLSLDAVVETHRAVGAPALEALLGARRAGYQLDGATLVRLADAGLPPSTIDVLVALSYPEHFEVLDVDDAPERVASRDPRPWDDGRGGGGYPRYGCYSYASRFYSPYGCDPYGWGSYGRWGGYGTPYYGGGVIVVEEEGKSGTAVKGQGYRKGEAPSTGTARPRVSPTDTDRATVRTGRGSPSVTSGGTKSGGGSTRAAPSTGRSGDSGRKAKPRGDG